MIGKRILIIDDDAQIRMVLSDRLEANGYHVIQAKDGAEGLKKTEVENPDVILLDLQMPGMSGLQVLQKLHKRILHIPVIMLTAHGTIESAVEAMKKGAFDFLPKPCKPDHILLIIDKALKQKNLVEENKLLREELDNQYQMVIGNSPEMKKIMDTINKVAPSSTTVLILGDSGTGKQLLSRTIHQLSNRRDKPFVQVNCTTLSEQLLESDLFGHEKGAFTGAITQKKGRFELADQGTVFLDEIGDLSPAIQARLLHVLEYGEFQRVGGVDTLKVEVRLIAATNKELSIEVKEGRFREDLFYRLNVVSLQLPPLRSRSEDIPLFSKHFLKKHSSAMNKNITCIPQETMTILMSYSWPGNIRELENTIERGVVLASGDQLTPDLLPTLMEITSHEQIETAKSLEEAILNFKKIYIRKTLQLTNYNQTKAAKLLNIQRTYLNRLMKELTISK